VQLAWQVNEYLIHTLQFMLMLNEKDQLQDTILANGCAQNIWMPDNLYIIML
jgi:hypothetical protein